jgi:hypothetical protein
MDSLGVGVTIWRNDGVKMDGESNKTVKTGTVAKDRTLEHGGSNEARISVGAMCYIMNDCNAYSLLN